MFVQLSIFGFFNDWMANFAQMPNGHIWIYVGFRGDYFY